MHHHPGGLINSDGAFVLIQNNQRNVLGMRPQGRQPRHYLIVDYASGSDPIAGIQTALANGYNAGAWNGTTGGSIRSSTAASTPGTAVGFGEASAALGASGGTFAGESVDGTTVLVSEVQIEPTFVCRPPTSKPSWSTVGLIEVLTSVFSGPSVPFTRSI